MKIAMLISASGTTASAILGAIKTGRLKNIEPVLVIASSGDVSGINRVKEAGMKTEDVIVVNPKTFASPEDFGKKIIEECEKRGVEFIGQYGWMCLTPKNVVEKYEGMMVNQHPGPLDVGSGHDFGGKGMFGLRVTAARIEFVRRTNHDFWTEAVAQRVAINFDEGAVLNTQREPILPEDTTESAADRLLPVQHEVQIKTLQDFADGKVKEIIRSEPLVKPEEYQILEECKKIAAQKYPNG